MIRLYLLVALSLAGAHATVGDAASCSLCEAVLSEAKVAWTDTATQDLVNLAKDAICGAVPIEDCDNWMTDQLHKIDAAVAALVPKQVCASLGICPAGEDLSLDSSPIPEMECDFCEFVGDEVKKYVLNNVTIDMLVNVTEEVCAKIPLISNECEALVKEYGQYYLHLLVNKIDVPALCTKVGLCKAEVRSMIQSNPFYLVALRGVETGEGCRACKDGLDMVKQILNSDDLKDLTHIAVKEFCSVVHFTGCDAIIEVVVNQIINEYVPKFDPEALCIQAGACEKPTPAPIVLEEEVGDAEICEVCHDALSELKKIANDPTTATIVKDIPAVVCESLSIPFCTHIVSGLVEGQFEKLKNMDPKKECVSLKACPAYGVLARALDAFKARGDGDKCGQCTKIADQVIAALKDEQVVNILKDEIGEVCSILPAVDHCQEYLNSVLDQAVELLTDSILKDADGKFFCILLNMCDAEPEEMTALGDAACTECTLITGMVISTLGSNETRQEITGVVEAVCEVLPGPVAKACESTVEEYVNMLLDYIAEMKPKDICSMIGMCSSYKETPAEPLKTEEECAECTKIADWVLIALRDEQVVLLLKDQIGELCSLLPLVDHCAETLDGILDQAVDLVTKSYNKDLDGKAWCTLLSYCDLEPEVKMVEATVGDTCSECTLITGMVITALTDKSTRDEITGVVEAVCEVLPGPVAKACESTVEEYVNMLLDYVVKMKPSDLCSLFGMCSFRSNI